DVGEDGDFKSGAWVSATNYVTATGGTVTRCFGDINNNLKKGKLDQRDDTDDESDDQELEAHYMYMAKLQQVSPDVDDSGPIFDKEPDQKVQNDDHYDVFAIDYQHTEKSKSVHNTYLIEQDAQNVLIESEDMIYDSEQIDQNDEDVDLAKEHELLSSLIAKLKYFKNKNKSLTEANNKLSEVNAHLYADYKKSKEELKRRNTVEYAMEMEELLSNKMEHKRTYGLLEVVNLDLVEPELRTIVEVAPMANNRTMEKLLQAPMEGYGEVVSIKKSNKNVVGPKNVIGLISQYKEVPISEGSSVTTTEMYMENYKNVLQDIRDQLNAEAEAVQIILTGIDNDIYSTIDACPNACEMWKAIERLKQHQNEVNELRAERIARIVNLLALVTQQQPVYHPQKHPTQYTQNSSTKSQQAATRNRGKAIVNSHPPIYDQEPSMVAKEDEISKDKEIDKLIALISLSFKKIYKPTNNNLQTSSNTSRTTQDISPMINRSAGYDNQRLGNVVGARETVGTMVVQKSRIQCYNCKEFRHGARECQKPKRAKDVDYHREKMLLCKQEEPGIQLNAEQDDWRDDTDDESEDQELEAHYIEQIDQNDDDDDDLANERELLASLIEKLKCEIDDNKNRKKILETSNKVLVDKLKELDGHNDVEYASKVEIDCAKAKRDLISYKMESQKSFNKYTQTINDLNQTISEMKKKLSAHQETISILSQAKED
nr:hypothetical protein [Tanacetum cinerariifolium]